MKKDPRINAKSMTFKNYLTIFGIMLFLCGSYAGLYFLQVDYNGLIYIILSMFAYILLLSVAVCAFFCFFQAPAGYETDLPDLRSGEEGCTG